MKTSRREHRNWVAQGRPGPPHSAFTDRKLSKKSLRGAMRPETAKKRTALYNQLMDKLFYKLVAAQRSGRQGRVSCIQVDGTLITDDDKLLKSWATHFESLGQPIEKSSFDGNYLHQVLADIQCISSLVDGRLPSSGSSWTYGRTYQACAPCDHTLNDMPV